MTGNRRDPQAFATDDIDQRWLRFTSSIIPAVIAGVYLLAFIYIGFEMSRSRYDWDIDHEMYFGGELLRGNVLWSREFHDKLPLVQVVFAVPAYFSSVTAWRLLSLAAALAAVFVVWVLLPRLLRAEGYDARSSRYFPALAGGIYLLSSALMPGGFTHINVFAASFSMIALVSVFAIARLDLAVWVQSVLLVVASVSASLGISFRPYMIFPLAVGFLAASVVSLRKRGRSARSQALVAVMLIAPAVTGILLNLWPFIVLGKVSAFLEGLAFFAQDLNPTPVSDGFFRRYLFEGTPWAVWVVLMLIVSIVVAMRMISLRRTSSFVWFVMPITAVALALAISTQHWWPHYSNFFSWHFAVLIAGPALVGLLWLTRVRERWFVVVSITVVAAITVATFTAGFVQRADRSASATDQRSEELRAVQVVLDSEFDIRPAFLIPENMHLHWTLSEPRHGFPHAANTNQIVNGWWEGFIDASNFLAPRNLAEYCAALQQSSVELVVLSPGSRLNSCLDAQPNPWRALPVSEDLGLNYVFWVRP